MKTPEEMAEEWANNRCPEQGPEFIVWCMCKEDFLAGYQAGFEIGCMKGSMAMQLVLDEDYRLTPIIDHQKLASRMTKKEIQNK